MQRTAVNPGLCHYVCIQEADRHTPMAVVTRRDPVPAARNALPAPARKLIAVTKRQTNSLLTRFNCHELQMLIDLKFIATEGD
jgi:hypothetical protein